LEDKLLMICKNFHQLDVKKNNAFKLWIFQLTS